MSVHGPARTESGPPLTDDENFVWVFSGVTGTAENDACSDGPTLGLREFGES